MQNRSKINRFTLIEVVIVIAITVIFALLCSFFYMKKREEARKLSCANNLRQIGLSSVFYYGVYPDHKPVPGQTGLQLLADNGFLINPKCYVCPNTKDCVPDSTQIKGNSSYAFAGALNEHDGLGSSVDSGMASDRADNHNNFGNILFVDRHVKGYAGANWSSNFRNSNLKDF